MLIEGKKQDGVESWTFAQTGEIPEYSIYLTCVKKT